MTVTLNSTESSLRSASEGAAAIDSLLRLLSRIPFLGNIDYDPSQSLDASLVQAADGLAPLGPPLAELQRDLNTFSTSLKGVRIGIRGTESRFTALRGNVVGIKKVLASSSDRLGELAEAVDQLNEHLRGIVVGVGIFLGWSAIWFALVNAALIQQGEKTAGISE
jgi:ABC-type transporter Mla subunit MlaD